MIPVSAIVMTRNEERNIRKCLVSLEGVAEVFVVDSGSEDRTRELAVELGATVVPFSWDGRYPKKKQWCLDNLPFAHDWVLFLDADEEMTPELRNELERLFQRGLDAAGYFVGFDYVFLGRTLRHGHRVTKLLLFDRHRARFPVQDDLEVAEPVEIELHFQPELDGRAGRLRGRVRHDDHDSLTHYFDRHNSYSDWEALLRNRGLLPAPTEAQPPGRKLLKRTFARLPFKAPLAFVYAYVLRLGFLDGRAGFHFAVARAMYYWQIGIKRRELRR